MATQYPAVSAINHILLLFIGLPSDANHALHDDWFQNLLFEILWIDAAPKLHVLALVSLFIKESLFCSIVTHFWYPQVETYILGVGIPNVLLWFLTLTALNMLNYTLTGLTNWLVDSIQPCSTQAKLSTISIFHPFPLFTFVAQKWIIFHQNRYNGNITDQ